MAKKINKKSIAAMVGVRTRAYNQVLKTGGSKTKQVQALTKLITARKKLNKVNPTKSNVKKLNDLYDTLGTIKTKSAQRKYAEYKNEVYIKNIYKTQKEAAAQVAQTKISQLSKDDKFYDYDKRDIWEDEYKLSRIERLKERLYDFIDRTNPDDVNMLNEIIAKLSSLPSAAVSRAISYLDLDKTYYDSSSNYIEELYDIKLKDVLDDLKYYIGE